MTSIQAVLKVISDGRFHSGEELGKIAGISRAAVWKLVHKLEKDFMLELHAVSGKGYRLAAPLDLLDRGRIETYQPQLMDSNTSPLEIVMAVDSTNRYIRDKLSSSILSGHVVLAEHQTAGRGRRGRNWISPFAENIYLSMLQVFDMDTSRLTGLSLAVAVATNRALIKLGAGGAEFKWPNDLHWQGRKLSGILLEMQGEASGAWNVIIGIGLNIGMQSQLAKDIEQEWIDLNSILGHRVDRNEAAAILIEELRIAMQQFRQHGLSAFVAEWRNFDVTLNKPVELCLHDRTVLGVARGIDEHGALQLEVNGVVSSYHAGDVSLRYQPDV